MSDKTLAILSALLASAWELTLAITASYEVYKWQKSEDAGLALFLVLMFWLYTGRDK